MMYFFDSLDLSVYLFILYYRIKDLSQHINGVVWIVYDPLCLPKMTFHWRLWVPCYME